MHSINITMQHLHNRQCYSSTVSVLLCNTYTIGYRYYLFISLISSSDRHPPPRDVPSRAPYPYIVTKRQGQVSCVSLSVAARAFWPSYMYTVHVHVHVLNIRRLNFLDTQPRVILPYIV